MEPNTVLYEDRYLLIVNKVPGIPVAPDKTGDETLLGKIGAYLDAASSGAGSRAGLPHRIDRPTSGAVIFSKDAKTLASLSEAFRQGRIRKTYWAAVDAPPPAASGTLVHYLSFDPRRNKAIARDAGAGPDGKEHGKKAVLHYTLRAQSERFYLLEVELETGRHHQIRAQLAKAGLHIKGDVKYGYPRTNNVPGIHLHAVRVRFTHPVTRQVLDITAAPPDDPVWNAFGALPGRTGTEEVKEE